MIHFTHVRKPSRQKKIHGSASSLLIPLISLQAERHMKHSQVMMYTVFLKVQQTNDKHGLVKRFRLVQGLDTYSCQTALTFVRGSEASGDIEIPTTYHTDLHINNCRRLSCEGCLVSGMVSLGGYSTPLVFSSSSVLFPFFLVSSSQN
jgi:hypothetical protein